MTKHEEQYGTFFIVGIVLFVLVVLVAILYGLKYVYKPHYPTITYNNFEFKQKDKFWHTLWQRNDKVYTISLRFNPKELEDIPITGVLNSTFNRRKTTHVTFDPQSDSDQFKYLAVAASELTVNMAGPLGKDIVAACTQNITSACADRPIVSCESNEKNVILLKAEGAPHIELNNTCMTLYGTGFDIVKTIDKMLYIWMQIIPT
ncbi:MAG: hypothetical protein HY363_06205 [Candidatus Aenigmarchaeota archaeon]|nr:hypothetical protein [Candidatus Aenigmarchaeota archaeon]